MPVQPLFDELGQLLGNPHKQFTLLLKDLVVIDVLFVLPGQLNVWSRAFRLGDSDADAPSSNRACGFPAHGFPCETDVIGNTSFW